MVEIIETIGFRSLIIGEVNDGIYAASISEPTDEELRKIEETEREYQRQKKKFRQKKLFGAVLFEEGFKTGAKNRAEQKAKAKKSKK